jgi:hypothetical protein
MLLLAFLETSSYRKTKKKYDPMRFSEEPLNICRRKDSSFIDDIRNECSNSHANLIYDDCSKVASKILENIIDIETEEKMGGNSEIHNNEIIKKENAEKEGHSKSKIDEENKDDVSKKGNRGSIQKHKSFTLEEDVLTHQIIWFDEVIHKSTSFYSPA